MPADEYNRISKKKISILTFENLLLYFCRYGFDWRFEIRSYRGLEKIFFLIDFIEN